MEVGGHYAHHYAEPATPTQMNTACTYPIVVLVIPMFEFSQSRIAYLAAAERFAIVSECVLFVAAFPVDALRYRLRDLWGVAVANVTSFVIGEAWWQWTC